MKRFWMVVLRITVFAPFLPFMLVGFFWGAVADGLGAGLQSWDEFTDWILGRIE